MMPAVQHQPRNYMKITERMIAQLAKMYPGKKIIRIPERNPQEVIVEIFKAPDDSFSIAVAIVIKSKPHYHEKTHETYRVLKGTVRLQNGTREGKIMGQHLRPNRSLASIHDCYLGRGFEVIFPGRHHCAWAIGRPATVLVTASPAWTPDDHHLSKRKPFHLKKG